MSRRSTFGKVVALAATGALALAACGGSSSGGGDENTLTMWHNATTGPGTEYWEQMAEEFEAETGVSIEIQVVQNEDLDGKLQTALNAGDAPDIFLSRGGEKLTAMVEAGQVKDITGLVSDGTRAALGEAGLSPLTVDGAVYGLPTSVLPGGIYYSKDLFEQAGIEAPPTTMEELDEAVQKLKDAGIQPVALGAKDAWPAAHWYYFFALRQCSQDTLATAAAEMDFSDECWLRAGEDLEEFAGTEPFNEGFLTTSAQQGAGSSAGLVANHQAAMELMGAWNPGVIASLTPDGEPLEDLGWFPFPAVEGGEGDPRAMMGGADGYSCSTDAPDTCVDFLNFVLENQENQEAYAEAFQTLPASQDAQGAVEDPALLDILDSYNTAPYVEVWLDTQYGQNVGNALNVAVVDMLAGKGDAQSIVQAAQNAASRG